MNITVVGCGYVGLSNALLLAQNNNVIALDVDPERVKKINHRESYIDEKEIEDFLKNKKLTLKATLNHFLGPSVAAVFHFHNLGARNDLETV